MRAIVAWALLFVGAIGGAWAQEASCPADRAAELGYQAFADFHAVMAPAWHRAWPDSDFTALFNAGPEFSRLFKPIGLMKPKFNSSSRRDAFLKNRQEFAQVVSDYFEACQKQDREQVYVLMPRLHSAFEATAALLVPISYPELEGIQITINLIKEHHLPEANRIGIEGSTATLAERASRLTIDQLPPDLAARRDEIAPRLEEVRAQIATLQRLLAADDMNGYSTALSGLESSVNRIIAEYL